MLWENVKEWCLEKLDGVNILGDQINARCPICGDSKKSLKKKRLWIKNTGENVIYHCFNCESSGSFFKLFSIVEKVDYDKARSRFESLENIRKRLIFKKMLKIKNDDKNNEFFDWILDDCVPESETGYVANKAKQRLKEFKRDRCIPDDIKLFFAYRGDFKNRIIIPIFDENNRIIYFQARALSSNIIPKYKNPKFDKKIKFDLNKIKDPVVVCEGLIDSFMFGDHGVPALGSSVSDEFLEQFINNNFDVIIALDNDKAGYNGLMKILTNSIYSSFLKYFLMPEKYKNFIDLNEVKIKNKDLNMIEFVLSNSYSKFKAEAMLRIDKWRFSDENN